MATRIGLGLIGCLIIAASPLGGAAADTHNVGGGLGWTIPPLGDIAYKNWAARENFEVGDNLVFTWNNTHNVAKVSKEEFDNCTSSNGPIQTTSPANFTIDSNGSSYFICTVNNHCRLGQKLEVTVDSSASALATTALSVFLLAMAISFLSFM
ncbi:unnamed protein product [Ilex paraguariensis]|uniref:Phytocyanin domain-containing protein n=1 Tax=Ilex paraguariensis TaxID=185542 RepID=A0ABC8TTY8_9AQUA